MSAKKHSKVDTARESFEYDAALSFAGEDRNIAKHLFQQLVAKGYKVFYDENRRARLWGHDSREFERIYSSASRYVIPIISSHYVRKDWTQWEFETATVEAKKRTKPFLLPVRLDDARLFGLKGDTIVADLQRLTVEDLAEDFDVRMKEVSAASTSAPERSSRKSTVHILSHTTRYALGLIATSGYPLGLTVYKTLFPQIRWDKEVRYLKRKNLLVKGQRQLNVPRDIQHVFKRDAKEMEYLNRSWANVLEHLKDHVDMALLLSLHYIGLDRLNEAVGVLADIVEGLEPSWWVDLYMTLLTKLTDKRILVGFEPAARVKLYNALGLCHLHKGQYKGAIEWFMRLRRCSKRVGHAWGTGQSYINCGVAEHRRGKDEAAERCYRGAIDHAEKTGDNLLLGRSLTNLAQMVMDESPTEGQSLIEKGICAKKAARDRMGLVASYVALGNLHAEQSEHSKAARYYQQAVKMARTIDARHYEALATHNLGSTYFDMGKFLTSLEHYRKVHKVCVAESYADLLILSAGGLARANYELRRYKRAETKYQELHNLKRAAEDRLGSLVAMHDVGMCRVKQGKFPEARKAINKALGIARKIGNAEWTSKCIIERTATFDRGKLSEVSVKRLKQAAIREQHSKSFAVAADLWETIAAILMHSQDQTDIVEMALRNCLSSLAKIRNRQSDRARIWSLVYLWRWQNSDYPAGLKALTRMEKVAKQGGLTIERIHAIDQRGVCLQELGRFKEAMKAHREALRYARRSNARYEMANSLSNLGEAMREIGCNTEAIKALLEAENIARVLEDYAGEITTAHNRAIVLEADGRNEESKTVLIWCRDQAMRRKLWNEYVRAWEGLANLSVCQGKVGLAERRYRRALAEAGKHGQNNMKPRIALNLAGLLREQKRHLDALRLLRPHEQAFADYLDAHLYYMTLGGLYLDAGQLRKAKTCWEAAKRVAQGLGDKDNVAYCAATLAEIHKDLGEPMLSDAQLRVALENETEPQGRSSLLVQRLGLLLDLGKEKPAEKVFEKARQLSLKHDLADPYIDIHMIYGDYAWRKDKKHKREALKAYIIGMLKGLEVGIDVFGELSSHVLHSLIFDGKGITANQIEVLYHDTEVWLCRQIGAKDASRWLLWPIRAASRAYPFAEKPSQLKRVLDEFLREEMAAFSRA